MHRRDALVLGLLVAAIVGIALVIRPLASDRSEQVHLSSYRLGPYGARALYLLAEELGFRTERQVEPLTHAAPSGALVLLRPVEVPTPREVDALFTWVNAGGTLIYSPAPNGGDSIAPTLGLALDHLRPDTLGRLSAVRWDGELASPEPHRWTAGMGAVPGFTFAFSDSSRALVAGTAEVLLATADGAPTVVALPVGRGRVVAWSDAAVLGNRPLRAGGAAVLFARAVSDAVDQDDVLRFDEYHQGYRANGSPARTVWRFTTGTDAGRTLLQLSAAGLLLLLLAGHRFGAPLEGRLRRRRSSLEHVEAVAAAYRRADARRTARRLLLAGLDRRLGRRATSSHAAPPHALHSARSARRLNEAREQGDAGDLVALAAAIDDFEAEVREWK